MVFGIPGFVQLSAALNESDILTYLHSKGLLADPKPASASSSMGSSNRDKASFPHSEYVRYYLIDNRVCLSVIEWEQPNVTGNENKGANTTPADDRATLKKRSTQAVFILRYAGD